MNATKHRGLLFLVVLNTALTCSAGVDMPVPYMAQPDNQTCLPTSLNMVLHYMGRMALTTDTVQALHKRTQYDRYNLPGILKDYGLYALPMWYELNWNADTLKRELNAGHPVITGCDVGRYGHFVLITGYTDDGRWIINDPTGSSEGYRLGGPHAVVDWDAFNWRGGVLIHPDPFPKPELSGKVTATTAPELLKPGETGTVQFEVINNGLRPWPDPLYLQAVEPSFTSSTVRESRFFVPGEWVSASRPVKADKATVNPGESARFVFSIRAPQINRPSVFKEYWTPVDAQGRRLCDSFLGGPGDWSMSFKTHVEPPRKWELPFAEDAKDSTPSSGWLVKYGSLSCDTTTAPPSGAKPLRLFTPGRPCDGAWVGDHGWKDYRVEAWVFCEYRAAEKPKGYERVGLFMRDNGDHAGTSKDMVEYGECYCMTYDSDDGHLRAGNIESGGVEDFLPKPQLYVKETGWHHFAIRCTGSKITYELDGKPFHEMNDRLRSSGSAGVFYDNRFKDRAMGHGIQFAGFKAQK